jgi:hypothetical protein
MRSSLHLLFMTGIEPINCTKQGECMKKIMLMFVGTALSVSLFGCGGGGGGGSDNGLAPITIPAAGFSGSYSGTFSGTPPAFTTVLRFNVRSTGGISGHTDNYLTGGSFSGTINSAGVFDAAQNSENSSDISLHGTVDSSGNVSGTWVNKADSQKTGSFTCTKVAAPVPRFVDTGKGTITDSVTKLTWLKDASCFPAQNWDAATASASTLASGQNKCGLTDGSVAGNWRLPTRDELQIFIDDGYTSGTLISAGFSNVQSVFYWSGSTYLFNPSDHAWSVNMSNGALPDFAGMNMGTAYNVWPVRTTPEQP